MRAGGGIKIANLGPSRTHPPQEPLGALQMRHVEHLAVEPDDSDAGLGVEGGDDGAGAGDDGLGRAKTSLITGTCAGWMAIFATKPSLRPASHSARRPASSRKLT